MISSFTVICIVVAVKYHCVLITNGGKYSLYFPPQNGNLVYIVEVDIRAIACAVPVKIRSLSSTAQIYVVSLPAPLVWKKQVFPDSTLPSPEGLVQNVRFTTRSRNERCRGIGTSGLERPRSLSLKIDPDADHCASGRVVLHLSTCFST